MGDLVRNHPPRGLALSQSGQPTSQSEFTPESKTAEDPVNREHANAFQLQHAPPPTREQPGIVHTPSAQRIMNYPRTTPTYNMSLMGAALPTQQTQVTPFAPFQQTLQHIPTSYGPPHSGHAHSAQQIPYPPQYQQIPYAMAVGPQGYTSYTPRMYSPYQAYMPQPNTVYQPNNFPSHLQQVQSIHQEAEHRGAQLRNAPAWNFAGPTNSRFGRPPEQYNNSRDFYLPPGQLTAIDSSGQIGVHGSSIDKDRHANVSMGPPRKPRQSGHALWVGNLPPGATVTDLKDHFSRGATKDIESVKLISRSNCAFVNYRTQAACVAAMNRFVDSRFHGTRLVCRLRRTSTNSPATVSTPAESSPRDLSSEGRSQFSDVDNASKGSPSSPAESGRDQNTTRFFILKSLTLHDLEISTRTGVWATQPHNEDALNEAFKSAENVYLIFSANKSGEYFGYARMCSPISPADGDAEVTGSKPVIVPVKESADPEILKLTTEFVSTIDLGPKAVPTPPTEWAPKGRIIDDSARDTIFWEADTDDESPPDTSKTPSTDAAFSSPSDSSEQLGLTGSLSESRRQSSISDQANADEVLGGSSGNTFRVEWLSTRKVQFFKSRGLRNPWNANREVKIARDGTELETSVGKRLLNLFGPPTSPGPQLFN